MKTRPSTAVTPRPAKLAAMLRRSGLAATADSLLTRCSPRWDAGCAGRMGGQVPVQRLLQPFFETGSRFEPEERLGAAGVELAAGLAVRLAGVPFDPALESRQPRDDRHEIVDRD